MEKVSEKNTIIETKALIMKLDPTLILAIEKALLKYPFDFENNLSKNIFSYIIPMKGKFVWYINKILTYIEQKI